MSNRWIKYNVSQQTYTPKSFNDVYVNKYDRLHNEFYTNALSLAIANAVDEDGKWLFDHIDIESPKFDELENNVFVKKISENKLKVVSTKEEADYFIPLGNYKIIEKNIPKAEYDTPSKVFVTQRGIQRLDEGVRIKRFELDLSEWWNGEWAASYDSIQSNDDIITKNLDDWYKYNDIVSYDYVNETATLENKVENKTRKVPFKCLSTDDTIKIDYRI